MKSITNKECFSALNADQSDEVKIDINQFEQFINSFDQRNVPKGDVLPADRLFLSDEEINKGFRIRFISPYAKYIGIDLSHGKDMSCINGECSCAI